MNGEQATLFDRMNYRNLTLGAARSFVGDFFEQAGAVVLDDARRLPIDPSAVWCPDLAINGKFFGESKSIGLNGNVIVYEDRLAKDRYMIDRPLLSEGRRLVYTLWRHSSKIKGITNLGDLRDSLAASAFELYLVEFDKLERLLLDRPVRVVNSAVIKSGPNAGDRNGYGNAAKGYGRGWTLTLSFVKALCQPAGVVAGEVYDRDGVQVFVTDDSLRGLIA